LGLLSVLFVLSLAMAQPAAAQVYGVDAELKVSPQTIVLERDEDVSGNVWITLHADILYEESYQVSVTIEGLDGSEAEAHSTFSDNRGDLVAKFSYEEIAEKLGEGPATLILEVVTPDGILPFSDDVRVVVRR